MSNIYIQEPPTNGKVLLTTTAGEIEIELWSKEAPLACRNFVQLCLEGYYNNTAFFRVIPGFIAQGGDPAGTGQGGDSIYSKPFKDEFHTRLRFVRRGLVAMANDGPNDNGSQFFFTLGPCKDLHNKHTIFGKVAGDTLYNLPRFEEGEMGKDDRPVYPHKITKSEVILNPYDDIVPRVSIANEISKEDRKKKKKGVKNFSLLSFGSEAEEEEAIVITTTRAMGGAGGAEPSLLQPVGDVGDIPLPERPGAMDRIREKLKRLTAASTVSTDHNSAQENVKKNSDATDTDRKEKKTEPHKKDKDSEDKHRKHKDKKDSKRERSAEPEDRHSRSEKKRRTSKDTKEDYDKSDQRENKSKDDKTRHKHHHHHDHNSNNKVDKVSPTADQTGNDSKTEGDTPAADKSADGVTAHTNTDKRPRRRFSSRKEGSPEKDESQKCGALVAKEDGAGFAKEDGAGVAKEDGAGVEKEDGAGVAKEDGAGVAKQDGAGVSKEDGAVVSKEDGADVEKTDNCGVGKEGVSGVDKKGDVSVAKDGDAGVDKKGSAGGDREGSDVVGKKDGASVDKEGGVSKKNVPGVVKKGSVSDVKKDSGVFEKSGSDAEEPKVMPVLVSRQDDAEKDKKREQVQNEIKQLKKELFSDRGGKEKDGKTKKDMEDKKENEVSKHSTAVQDYWKEKEKYVSQTRSLPKKGVTKREDATLAFFQKFRNKVKATLAVNEEGGGGGDDGDEDEKDDDDVNGDDWLRQHVLFDASTPVLAKDASSKDDSWRPLDDPRHPLNKRRRGEAHI